MSNPQNHRQIDFSFNFLPSEKVKKRISEMHQLKFSEALTRLG